MKVPCFSCRQNFCSFFSFFFFFFQQNCPNIIMMMMPSVCDMVNVWEIHEKSKLLFLQPIVWIAAIQHLQLIAWYLLKLKCCCSLFPHIYIILIYQAICMYIYVVFLLLPFHFDNWENSRKSDKFLQYTTLVSGDTMFSVKGNERTDDIKEWNGNVENVSNLKRPYIMTIYV